MEKFREGPIGLEPVPVMNVVKPPPAVFPQYRYLNVHIGYDEKKALNGWVLFHVSRGFPAQLIEPMGTAPAIDPLGDGLPEKAEGIDGVDGVRFKLRQLFQDTRSPGGVELPPRGRTAPRFPLSRNRHLPPNRFNGYVVIVVTHREFLEDTFSGLTWMAVTLTDAHTAPGYLASAGESTPAAATETVADTDSRRPGKAF